MDISRATRRKILRRLPWLAIPLATLVLIWQMAARNLDDRVSDRRLPNLYALQERIDGYAKDVGHLPTSLSELLESKQSGWDGPYANAWLLRDVDGADISYEVLDARRFRIVLPARRQEGKLVWPEIAKGFALGDAALVER